MSVQGGVEENNDDDNVDSDNGGCPGDGAECSGANASCHVGTTATAAVVVATVGVDSNGGVSTEKNVNATASVAGGVGDGRPENVLLVFDSDTDEDGGGFSGTNARVNIGIGGDDDDDVIGKKDNASAATENELIVVAAAVASLPPKSYSSSHNKNSCSSSSNEDEMPASHTSKSLSAFNTKPIPTYSVPNLPSDSSCDEEYRLTYNFQPQSSLSLSASTANNIPNSPSLGDSPGDCPTNPPNPQHALTSPQASREHEGSSLVPSSPPLAPSPPPPCLPLTASPSPGTVMHLYGFLSWGLGFLILILSYVF